MVMLSSSAAATSAALQGPRGRCEEMEPIICRTRFNSGASGSCMVVLVWLCLYGCACMVVLVWLCLYGCACMVVLVWLCLYGCACMVVFVWLCLYGCACMVLRLH